MFWPVHVDGLWAFLGLIGGSPQLPPSTLTAERFKNPFPIDPLTIFLME